MLKDSDDRSLRPRRKRQSPALSQQYLCIEDPNLGLNVFALNREQLQAEILAQIDFLRDEYACAPDSELNTEALALKTRLLSVLEDSSMQGAPDG